MTYYRVKPEHDNYPKYVYAKDGQIKVDGILVGNQLFTPGERKKIANNDKFFDKIHTSCRKTYWFFGARFKFEEGPVHYE